jgi:hypothetical protein
MRARNAVDKETPASIRLPGDFRQISTKFIPHAPKNRSPLLLETGKGGGVFKAMVQPFHGAEEHRAVLAGVVAYSDHGIERLPREFIDVLGAMARDIDSELAHNGNRFRAHRAGFCTGAPDLKPLTGVVP